MKCKHCNGTGRRMEESDNGIGWIPVKCEYCNGTGKVEITEQEYIQTCTTEQLAEVLWEKINGAFNSGYACCNLKQDKDYVGRYKRFKEWLKQPHR